MYCYTVATGLKCVLQELTLWSTISSEHPVFIKTVAKLTNKKLPAELTNELDSVRQQFLKIKEDVEDLENQIPMGHMDNRVMPMEQFPVDFSGMPAMPPAQQMPNPYEMPPMMQGTMQQPMQFGPQPQMMQQMMQPQMMPPQMMQNQMHVMHINEVRKLIDRFMKTDNMFLGVLNKVKKYGANDEVWQTLLRHITDEQEYMYTLMENLKPQLRKL